MPFSRDGVAAASRFEKFPSFCEGDFPRFHQELDHMSGAAEFLDIVSPLGEREERGIGLVLAFALCDVVSVRESPDFDQAIFRDDFCALRESLHGDQFPKG